VKISLGTLQPKGACIQSAGADTRNASQDQFLDYKCASQLHHAAGEKLRHVPVSWAALCPAAARQHLSIYGTEIRAQGRAENSIRVGSVGRGYFETRWPQFVPPESADQAIAKVFAFPAPTDCKSADECVPRDNLFAGSAGQARS
jgi:hypothetical protein